MKRSAIIWWVNPILILAQVIPMIAQKECDTIFLKSGLTFTGIIDKSDKQGILFHPCTGNSDKQLYLKVEDVDEIRTWKKRQKGKAKQTVVWNGQAKLRKPIKNRNTIWLSLIPVAANSFDDPRLLPQAGFEWPIGKDRQYSLAVYLSPLARTNGGYRDSHPSGFNGEAEFGLKRFGYYWISGARRPFFIGATFRYIQHNFNYVKDGEPLNVRGATKQFMFNLGWQVVKKGIAYEFSFPIGLALVVYDQISVNGLKERLYDSSGMLMPALSIGYRFH